MGIGTVLLMILGALLGTCLMTLLLDAFATFCFRPLQTIQTTQPGYSRPEE